SRPAAQRPHRREACLNLYSCGPPGPGLRAPTALGPLPARQRFAADRVLAIVSDTPHNDQSRYRNVARSSCVRFPADTAAPSGRRLPVLRSYTVRAEPRGCLGPLVLGG